MAQRHDTWWSRMAQQLGEKIVKKVASGVVDTRLVESLIHMLGEEGQKILSGTITYGSAVVTKLPRSLFPKGERGDAIHDLTQDLVLEFLKELGRAVAQKGKGISEKDIARAFGIAEKVADEDVVIDRQFFHKKICSLAPQSSKHRRVRFVKRSEAANMGLIPCPICNRKDQSRGQEQQGQRRRSPASIMGEDPESAKRVNYWLGLVFAHYPEQYEEVMRALSNLDTSEELKALAAASTTEEFIRVAHLLEEGSVRVQVKRSAEAFKREVANVVKTFIAKPVEKTAEAVKNAYQRWDATCIGMEESIKRSIEEADREREAERRRALPPARVQKGFLRRFWEDFKHTLRLFTTK